MYKGVRYTDNLKAVYKILSALEKAMDCPSFDVSQIDYNKLEISKERWSRYIEMMLDVGYIKGAKIYKDILGETCVETDNIRITLKGLEYLQENSIMQKFYNAAKGIVDLIP